MLEEGVEFLYSSKKDYEETLPLVGKFQIPRYTPTLVTRRQDLSLNLYIKPRPRLEPKH